MQISCWKQTAKECMWSRQNSAHTGSGHTTTAVPKKLASRASRTTSLSRLHVLKQYQRIFKALGGGQLPHGQVGSS